MEHGKTETLVVRRSTFQTSAGVDKRRALISFGSIVALIGFILSDPVGFGLVQLAKPQPTRFSRLWLLEHPDDGAAHAYLWGI